MGVRFAPEHGSKLRSMWEEAGAGRPVRQECEDCGVCSVLEGERLNDGLACAGWRHTLKDKLLSQGQGTPRVGEKRAVRAS